VTHLFAEGVLFTEMLLQQTNGANNTNCDGTLNPNLGCGVIEWSRASYGPYFDAQGGGVFAMKWDENGISVCQFFAPKSRRKTSVLMFIFRVFLPCCYPARYCDR